MNATVAHNDPLLIARHADVLVTMDAQRREIPDGALVARGGVIEWVGATADLPSQYREAIGQPNVCLLYTSPSPRDRQKSRMPSSA